MVIIWLYTIIRIGIGPEAKVNPYSQSVLLCFFILFLQKIPKGSLQKKQFDICHQGRGGVRGDSSPTKKIAKMISGSFGAFMVFPFFRGGPILRLEGGF